MEKMACQLWPAHCQVLNSNCSAQLSNSNIIFQDNQLEGHPLLKHCMHIFHQTAQLPCAVCCVRLAQLPCVVCRVRLYNSLCNKLSSTHICRSAGTWFWSILMMHASMKALYALGEQHSPTCCPAVLTPPADMSMHSQELEGFCMVHTACTSHCTSQLQSSVQ